MVIDLFMEEDFEVLVFVVIKVDNICGFVKCIVSVIVLG